MPRCNPSPKLAITVDAEIDQRVRAAAAQDGVSVSAWMTEAARSRLAVRDGLAAVVDWEAEELALTTDEIAAANRRVDAQLGAAAQRAAS